MGPVQAKSAVNLIFQKNWPKAVIILAVNQLRAGHICWRREGVKGGQVTYGCLVFDEVECICNERLHILRSVTHSHG